MVGAVDLMHRMETVALEMQILGLLAGEDGLLATPAAPQGIVFLLWSCMGSVERHIDVLLAWRRLKPASAN
jgi:hypothetical protein